MKLIKFTLALLISLLATLSVYAQNIVVSEYRHGSGVTAEEIELLVIEDNTTIVGYYIRDNSENDGWQGGVTFADVRLWRGLREGTIIVLRTRGQQQIDIDPSDGYIEIGVENTTYFTKRMSGGDISEWDNRALNFNTVHDMVQILNESDRNVHCLAHLESNTGDFAAISGPKLGHNGQIISGSSVSVYPGQDLSDYNQGFDLNNNYSEVIQRTIGFPNRESANAGLNQLFWRQLRQPEWNTPQFTQTDLNPDTKRLTLRWNGADGASINDGTQGYLLVRIPLSQIGNANPPVDGKIYNLSSTLGSAEVIYQGSNEFYVDEFTLNDCGKEFVYRAYAYRYSKDQQSEDSKPENGRGRSYNESSFAEVEFTIPQPPKPEIEIIGGDQILCEDDLGRIKLKAVHDDVDYQYEWRHNGAIVADYSEGKQELTIQNTGRYFVVIKNAMGCTATSDEIFVGVIDRPIAQILRDDFSQIMKDTTYDLCKGDELTLRAAAPGDTSDFQWYKDGAPLNGETGAELSPVVNGEYYVEASNWDICTDESSTVTVNFRSYVFVSSTSLIDFSVAANDTYAEKKITIENQGSTEMVFYNYNIVDENFNLPITVTIVDPTTEPYVIPVGESLEFTFRFEPSQPGDYTGNIRFQQPCGQFISINVTGKKEAPGELLSSENNSYDYGKMLACTEDPKDTLINIWNRGPQSVEVQEPVFDPAIAAQFTLVSPAAADFPINMTASETITLLVEFFDNTENVYSGNLTIPYKIDDNTNKELSILLRGEVAEPKFSLSANPLNFTLDQGDTFADKTIQVTNDGNVALIINMQPANPVVMFMNLPVTLQPGETDDLLVRFEPQDNNDLNIDININVTADECDTQVPLTVRGSRKGLDVSLTKAKIDFGTVSFCGNDVNIITYDTLIVSGESGEDPVIEDIVFTGNIQNYVDINLQPGMILKDDNYPLIVTLFSNAPEDNYTGSINIVFNPPDKTVVMELSANVGEPDILLETNQVTFPDVILPGESNYILTITNNGSAPATVNALQNVNPPFFIDDTNGDQLPVTLTRDETAEIYLIYRPQSTGSHEITATVDIGDPCPETYDVILKGNARSDQEGEVVVIIPDITAKPGERILIPVRMAAVEPFEIENADITDLSFKIGYDQFLFYPQSVIRGSDIPEDAVEAINLKTDIPGEADINISFSNPGLVNGGEIFQLSGMVLLGKTLEGNIDLMDLTINSDVPVTLSNNIDGILAIEGDCLIEERMISLEGELAIMLDGANPVSESTDIIFNTVSEDQTTLEIYDSFGSKKSTLAQGIFNPDFSHRVKLDYGEYSTGVYFAVLQNGDKLKTIKIVIIR